MMNKFGIACSGQTSRHTSHVMAAGLFLTRLFNKLKMSVREKCFQI